MIYTTLNKIHAFRPCKDGWKKLLAHLGKTKADDEPLPLVTILDSNGLDDCLWCVRTVPEHDRLWRLYAVWCARQLIDAEPDESSLAALDVAELYANGDSTDKELAAARAAARTAVETSAWSAFMDAALAATLMDAAEAAFMAATGDAAEAKLREVLTAGTL